MSALPSEPPPGAPVDAALDAPVDAPFDLAAPWGGRSVVTDLGGPVHWVDFGGPDGAPQVLLVHGLGGSHLNWVQLASRLRRSYRVAAIDVPGFGLTESRGRDTGVRTNSALVGRFVREVLGGPVVLVGNSMGGLISMLTANAERDLVRGVVLLDPALPLPPRRPDPVVAVQFGLYAIPVVGERFLVRMRGRWNDRQLVMGTIKLCFADVSRVDPDVVDASIRLTAYRRGLPGQERDFLRAARSVLAAIRRPGRYLDLMRGIHQPVLFVHGELDRLVNIDAARRAARANPAWQAVWLPGVGHTPQLEVPHVVADHLEPWLAALPVKTA